MAAVQERSQEYVPTVVVHSSGRVTGDEQTYAKGVIAAALVLAPGGLRFATIDLRFEPEPAWDRPALARVVVLQDGCSVRVHADATTVSDAVEMVGLRLRRRLEEVARPA